MVDGIDAAKGGANFATAGFEMNTGVTVNDRRVGDRLGIGHIDRLAAGQPISYSEGMGVASSRV